jgi:hypothetical protein
MQSPDDFRRTRLYVSLKRYLSYPNTVHAFSAKALNQPPDHAEH